MVRILFVILIICSGFSGEPTARDLELQEALEIAVAKTGRGSIIDGNLDVAEQKYFAERINYYLPEISINGSLPAYSVRKEYGFVQGTNFKADRETTSLDFNSDITLQQNLITGGDITFIARLVNSDAQVPILSGTFDEKWNYGKFDFSFSQPLLQPSQAKHDLKNSRNDVDLAKFKRIEEIAALRSEVVDAFFGVLQMQIDEQIKNDQLQSARLQHEIDSIKLIDGILSEEDYLESTSNFLDAELERFDALNATSTQNKTLTTLLDWDLPETLNPILPVAPKELNEMALQSCIDRWESCLSILSAKAEFDKAQRAAKFSGGGHGLQGTLKVDYGLDRGDIETSWRDSSLTRELNNSRWGISINFTYPLWDGGASRAQVKASELASEQSRMEFDKACKTAKMEIETLVNSLRISHRKHSVLARQVDLSQSRLNIAQERFDDGQISMLTFLDVRVSFCETKDKLYQELKDFYKKQADLEGKFLN